MCAPASDGEQRVAGRGVHGPHQVDGAQAAVQARRQAGAHGFEVPSSRVGGQAGAHAASSARRDVRPAAPGTAAAPSK